MTSLPTSVFKEHKRLTEKLVSFYFQYIGKWTSHVLAQSDIVKSCYFMATIGVTKGKLNCLIDSRKTFTNKLHDKT